MKNKRLTIGALVVGMLFLALSFGAKWIIFNTVLESDGTGRQLFVPKKP